MIGFEPVSNGCMKRVLTTALYKSRLISMFLVSLFFALNCSSMDPQAHDLNI